MAWTVTHAALHLAEVKETEAVGPVLIHVVTEKGRGYQPAIMAQDKMHGVVKYDYRTGKQAKKAAKVCADWHESLFTSYQVQDAVLP